MNNKKLNLITVSMLTVLSACSNESADVPTQQKIEAQSVSFTAQKTDTVESDGTIVRKLETLENTQVVNYLDNIKEILTANLPTLTSDEIDSLALKLDLTLTDKLAQTNNAIQVLTDDGISDDKLVEKIADLISGAYSNEKNTIFQTHGYDGSNTTPVIVLKPLPNSEGEVFRVKNKTDVALSEEEFAYTSISLKVNPVEVIHPDKCSTDPDSIITEYPDTIDFDIKSPLFMDRQKVAQLEIIAKENPFDEQVSYRVPSVDVATILEGESFKLNFNLPTERWGVTYNAKLNFAGESQQFKIILPEGDNKPESVNFDLTQAVIQPYNQFNSKRLQEYLFNDTSYSKYKVALPVDDNDQTKPLENGFVYTFFSAPITGLSQNLKHNFEFKYKGDYSAQDVEFIERIENEKLKETFDETKQVADFKVWVLSPSDASTKSTEGIKLFDSCARQDDVIAFTIAIPPETYGKNYQGTLTWNYFDENDEAQVQVIDINFAGEAQDSTPAKLDVANLFQVKSNLVMPNKDISYSVALDDFTAAADISITNGMVSVDGAEYSTSASILPGQTLTVKVTSPAAGSSIEPVLTIAGENYSWVVSSQDQNAQFKASIDFPTSYAATLSDKVTLRGHAGFYRSGSLVTSNPPQTITNQDILINGSVVDSYDANTGIWIKELSNLTQGNHAIELNLSSQVTTEIYMDVKQTNIVKLSDESNLFPSGHKLTLSQLGDVTVDNRTARIYFSDTEDKTVYSMPIASNAETVMAGLSDKFATSDLINPDSKTKFYREMNGKVTSIQANNGKAPELSYLFITDVTDVMEYAKIQPESLIVRVTPEAYLAKENMLKNSKQLTFDDSGNVLYVTGDGFGQVKTNYGITYEAELNDDKEDTYEYSYQEAPDVKTITPVNNMDVFGATHYNEISNIFDNTVSVDVLTMGTGDAAKQYIFVLGTGPVGDATAEGVWFIEKTDDNIYEAATSAQFLPLTDDVVLTNATSIVIDDTSMIAYISHNGNEVVKVDLANFDGTVEDGETYMVSLVALTSTENELSSLSAMTMEGGLSYILATDSSNNALFAIDPVTGEKVYLFKQAQTATE